MGLVKGGARDDCTGGREEVVGRGAGVGVEKPSGAKEVMPVELGRVIGLVRPVVRGGGLTAEAIVGGEGLAGGVVSIPLSSIIVPPVN